ncbi:eCIS core domain-containing protein [Rhodopila sp.]|uniref:eCIS core domain-containing protein n=1 Tax=Rhodopila sp. TaxID=2480087 RepID=UPI003D09D662
MPARAQSPPEQAQPRPLPPALIDYIAIVLARLIEVARQQAIADGVRPIPSAVYRSLLGYFPPALLRKTRFASGKAEALTLPALAFSYGDAIALTLGEVVLFKSERLAQSDLQLWAHELTHLMQYQRWGIDGFAERYARDSAAVEREAIDNANRFMAWHSQRGS